MDYLIRQASMEDISQILTLRYQAVENQLLNEITYEMVADSLKKNCCAWVAISDEVVVGFSLADKKNKNIWGLFVLPSYQQKGIGRALLVEAVNWLSTTAKDLWFLPCRKIWLNTEIEGRAEGFYHHLGWQKGKKVSATEVRYWYHIRR